MPFLQSYKLSDFLHGALKWEAFQWIVCSQENADVVSRAAWSERTGLIPFEGSFCCPYIFSNVCQYFACIACNFSIILCELPCLHYCEPTQSFLLPSLLVKVWYASEVAHTPQFAIICNTGEAHNWLMIHLKFVRIPFYPRQKSLTRP